MTMQVYYETGKIKYLDNKEIYAYDDIDEGYRECTELEAIQRAERLGENRVKERFHHGEYFKEYTIERGHHWVYYGTGKFENKWLNVVLKKERIMELFGVTEL